MSHSCGDIRKEVQSLQKALNFEGDFSLHPNGLLSPLDDLMDEHGSGSVIDHLTDSGYSSRIYSQSSTNIQNGVHSRDPNLAYHSVSKQVGHNSPFSSQRLNSQGTSLNSSSFFERSLKSSLDESEAKRLLLLEKLREAHLTIQNQAEKLAEGESEICFLRCQLKSISIEQEGLQQEVDSLIMERKTLEFFKSQSLKNREEFLIRVNDLDKALQALTSKHTTLQTEAEKKEAVLQKIQRHAISLQKDNERLQEVNRGLTKELRCLGISGDQQESDASRQLKQVNKDYQKVLEQMAVMKHQLSENLKVQKKAKSIQEKLSQEIIQIRMERDIECGKVIVLEEEIQHHQRNYNNLIKEQERLLKDKAEQDQRLQREIQERLGLKMVNDLLKEESAHVKEAFQKLEEFTGSMDHRAKELSQNQQETPLGKDEKASFKNGYSDLLSKIAKAERDSADLESQLSSLHEANKMLKTEKETLETQLQFAKMQESNFTSQQLSKSRELKTENDSLKLSLNTISKRNNELEKVLECHNEETKSLQQKIKELSHSATESPKKETFRILQDEVDKIKKTVTRLEAEKVDLISRVSKMHNEQGEWCLQKSELEMSLAELNAENTQLRSQLQSTKESFDEVCLELETVKSELSKVWRILEEKEKVLEHRVQDVHKEKRQSRKLTEELAKLRKDYAELTTKTASRSQMICTLRDELSRSCQEIIKLETDPCSTQQKCITLEKLTLKEKKSSAGLKRRRSDGDISSNYFKSSQERNETKKLTTENTQLKQRIEEVMAERDSVLQDAQDLLNGMQQLKEAFEEELEIELERERANYEKEKNLFQIALEKNTDKEQFGVNSMMETEITQLTEEKNALEVKSKNLECERDELRNQVEELCRMRTAAEEKAVQVDTALSPRKRDNKQTMRKRSKSVDVIAHPYVINQEKK
ncbi:hypothetical protein P5673_011822 [Acropora cervicornis]|uniref:Uncharacterized protein n=1 Tax=Acropora cervicornis TaxID=6130 RepID=A0AAD9V886_ACRCE|nr:hypothetical protein P5673_011822 [Acropora cervicornis]